MDHDENCKAYTVWNIKTIKVKAKIIHKILAIAFLKIYSSNTYKL
jgi:hypothetical protein